MHQEAGWNVKSQTFLPLHRVVRDEKVFILLADTLPIGGECRRNEVDEHEAE
ncbi:hypothetical protein ABWW58_05590 [Sporolactobacillus sp. STCC-11]|uniref:hypothetical protein n=1 Tax=Sporolactobacillus caesalpiniae TaxID=3230362 RepID=UPI003390B1C8